MKKKESDFKNLYNNPRMNQNFNYQSNSDSNSNNLQSQLLPQLGADATQISNNMKRKSTHGSHKLSGVFELDQLDRKTSLDDLPTNLIDS